MDSATYSASSRLQAAGLQPAIALFEDAARSVPLPRAPQPIAIADYGAANGYNSLLPVNTAIRVLRGRTRSDRAILVVHTDVAEVALVAIEALLDGVRRGVVVVAHDTTADVGERHRCTCRQQVRHEVQLALELEDLGVAALHGTCLRTGRRAPREAAA